MPLNDFQDKFKSLMLDGPEALSRVDHDFAAQFEAGDIALEERLKVYRNNILGSLSDIMVKNFPYVEKLVGGEFLKGMARAFILKNPPQQGCLNFYGRGFAEFIEGYKAAKPIAYLADMARLEIALNDSYYAYDDEALDIQDLARVPEDRLDDVKLKLRQSTQLVSSDYPLLALKAFCDDPDNSPMPNMDQGCQLMVLRQGYHVSAVPLDGDEFFALSQFAAGCNFGDCAMRTLEKFPDFSLPDFLQKHAGLETFRSIGTN